MSSPRPNTVDIEQGLLELFRRGLRDAVQNEVGPPEKKLDSIRTHKLVLCGIREFDLESQVTTQWYLDGDMLPNLPSENDGVTIVTNAGFDEGPFPSRQEVRDYYLEDLEDSIPTEETLSRILEQDAFKWLKKYYSAREIPFSEVYQTNLEIYLRLQNFQKYLNPDDQCQELTGSTTPENIANEISDATERMKEALIEHALFQSIPPYVTEFNRTANQILNRISEDIKKEGDNEEYYKLVSHLSRFYYKAVWQPIADRIGYYTVSAPSDQKEKETREYRTQNLQLAQGEFFDELNQLRDKAREFDIRFEVRTERLPRFNPEESGLEEVLSLDIDAAEAS